MKSLDRFVNFSDAVMAIAVTLLVLPLAQRASDLHVTSYAQFWSAFSHLILIFVLSFVVICRYWEVHHNLLNSVSSFNIGLFWLNAAWLLSIALIPFTSELIGNNSNNNVFINSIYIGSLLITSYLGVAIQLVILHSPSIQKSSLSKKLPSTYGIASAIAMTLALLLNIVLPSVGIWSLLLLIPVGYVSRASRKRST